MGDHPNVEAMRDLLDAFNAGDEEQIRAHMAEDVKWHMIGGDTVVGVDALAEAMGTGGDADFSIEAEVHDVVGNDTHVIALVNAKATAGGQTFEYRTAEIAHMKDGRITERWAFSDDTGAINDFFAQLG